MRIDLHLHSTASDGACGPTEVVRLAHEGGLDVIALADHDTVGGVEEALRASSALPIHVIPAIEVSSTQAGSELHILGYFVDLDADALRSHEEAASTRRTDRMKEMLERLSGLGVALDFDSVVEAAGPDVQSLGRPHLARALEDQGLVGSRDEAFQRYLADGLPAFVPTDLGSPQSAVRTILASGGIPVWAHPPKDLVESVLPDLMAEGLRGLEVYRPRSSPAHVLALESLSRKHGLLRTGGSDWHGPGDSSLGDFFVAADEAREFLDAGGL